MLEIGGQFPMLEILKCYSFSNSLPSQIANKENVSCSYSQRLGTAGSRLDRW